MAGNERLTIEEEREMAAWLGRIGLPDDLPEVALGGEPGPSAESLARIRRLTLARIDARTIRSRRWLVPAAAAAIVLMGLFAAFGPSKVLAEVQRILRYVPGIGIRTQEEFSLAAGKPITIKNGDGELRILGVMADSRSTVVRLQARNFPDAHGWLSPDFGRGPLFAQVFLIEESGARHPAGPSSLGSGGDFREAWIGFGPVSSSSRKVWLAFPGEGASEETRIEISLVPSDALTSLEQLGPSATVRGVSLAATADFNPENTDITVLARPDQPEAMVVELGPWAATPDRSIRLVDDQGREYEEINLGGGTLGVINYRRFRPLLPGSTRATLIVPVVSVREKGTATVELPVPEDGSVAVDRVVQLGRFELRLTRVERIPGETWVEPIVDKAKAEQVGRGAPTEGIIREEPDKLRVYVNPGPAGPEELKEFALQPSRSMSGYGAVLDGLSERILYLEVPVEPGQREIRLTLKDPVVSVKGPWVLEFLITTR
jgi:hypothetical protein